MCFDFSTRLRFSFFSDLKIYLFHKIKFFENLAAEMIQKFGWNTWQSKNAAILYKYSVGIFRDTNGVVYKTYLWLFEDINIKRIQYS